MREQCRDAPGADRTLAKILTTGVPRCHDVASTGISGFRDQPAETLAPRLWADVVHAFPALGTEMPAYRIIKEKRATIRQSAADEAVRPVSRSRFANLWLAGDWTRTGLPATIEGSLQSGFEAAQLALRAGAQ